jgi:hypothetical protein
MTTKTTVGGDSTTIPETGFSKIVHFKTAILPYINMANTSIAVEILTT